MCVFKDRKEAGRLLAQRLLKYKDVDGIVLGIPSGGVPVAAEIAKALALSLDVIIVRKIQLPDNHEAGFGAVGPDGEVSLNTEPYQSTPSHEERGQKTNTDNGGYNQKAQRAFREGRQFTLLKDKVVIIVDDGLASGYTMLSAIDFIKDINRKGCCLGSNSAERNS